MYYTSVLWILISIFDLMRRRKPANHRAEGGTNPPTRRRTPKKSVFKIKFLIIGPEGSCSAPSDGRQVQLPPCILPLPLILLLLSPALLGSPSHKHALGRTARSPVYECHRALKIPLRRSAPRPETGAPHAASTLPAASQASAWNPPSPSKPLPRGHAPGKHL